jgi:hypothetical protein
MAPYYFRYLDQSVCEDNLLILLNPTLTLPHRDWE